MNETSMVFWAAFGGGAAAGLITLVAVLVAEWFRWFLDRPLVKVSVSFGYLLPSPDKTLQILFNARNPHTKPVVLSRFGFSFRRKEWGPVQILPSEGYQFPYRLDGDCSIQQWVPLQELLDTLKEHGRVPSDLKWVWFESSSGKLFRSRIGRNTIQALEREFSKTIH